MRFTTMLMAAATAVVTAAPAAAQEGPLVMAHFLDVELQDVPRFEEAAREHVAWHAEQNDPWAWPLYSAMTGKGIEYVYLSPGHTWADFDDPPIDPADDMADWLETGGEYVAGIETMAWVQIPEVSNLPDDPSYMPPIVQVFEWEITGNEEAIMHIVGMYKEAFDELGMDGYFEWSRVVSNEGPPRIFIAVYFESFAEMDEEGPNPMEVMAEVHGEYAVREAAEAAGAAWTPTNSRIWTLVPDLSYTPSM